MADQSTPDPSAGGGTVDWPCANYAAPGTCLTAPSSEAGRCEWCATQAAALSAENEQLREALGKVTALADEWESQGMTTFTGARLCDILRAALGDQP